MSFKKLTDDLLNVFLISITLSLLLRSVYEIFVNYGRGGLCTFIFSSFISAVGYSFYKFYKGRNKNEL